MHRLHSSSALAVLLLWASQAADAEMWHLPLLPSGSDASRLGMVRIVNHSAEAGAVDITAIDELGRYYGPVTLNLEAHTAIQFSSTELEQGSGKLEASSGVGAGRGDWRLLLESDLAIEPLAYARTPNGFVDTLHDSVPRRYFYHRAALSAPDSIHAAGGTLRLINRGYIESEVVLFGLDDTGSAAFRPPVVLRLPPGRSRSVTASDLQDGAAGLDGRLGAADGDWRLLIFAAGDIEVMTLLHNPDGPLANLSTADSSDGEIVLFPAAADPSRQGMLRIASRTGAGDVSIRAIDDAGTRFGPVTLQLEADRIVNLDSDDLQTGNASKGLPDGLESGTGDWRLRLSSDLELDVFAYVRMQDGFLTAVQDVAGARGRRHHVPLFQSASTLRQGAQLRLINPGDERVAIRIQAWDDAGNAAQNGTVRVSLPPGVTRTIGASELEDGADELDGSLGQGEDNWRLLVEADRDIFVQSLARSPDGYLTNLSTSSILPRFLDACVGGPRDADDDGIADHCDTDTRSVCSAVAAMAPTSARPGSIPVASAIAAC